MSYSIYIHTNKINGKVYIGQTKQKPEYRWKRNGKGYNDCEIMKKAILKYGWDNFDHKILMTGLDLAEANFYEEKLIKDYKSTNKKYGYNILSGGKNSTPSERTRKKLSEAKKGEKHHQYGKKRTQEEKDKISKSKSLPIIQMDKEGLFIAEYNSTKEACIKLGFTDSTCISKACKGQRKTAHKFKWKYKEWSDVK